MPVHTFPEAATPAPWRCQVLALQDAAWPPGPDTPASTGPTHDPALRPVSLLLVDDDHVLAALDVLTKDLTHAGARWVASGLSTVVTDPRARGLGHGRRLVEAAAGWIHRSGADLALFTCDRPLAGFYTGAGFEVLPDTVLVGGTPADPLRSDAPGFDKVTLAAFHTARAEAARARFTGAEIALYPGTVDRLW